MIRSTPPRPRRKGGIGRPPQPRALLKIRGTFRSDRHDSAGEPQAEGDLATRPPPEWMTASQREFWTETLLDAPKDVLRRIDWALFAGYVETWDRYTRLVRAQQRLDAATEVPFLIKGASGPHISPYLRQMDRCLLLLARYGGEMGFTPAGRARLAVARLQDEDAAANDWAALRQLRLVHDRDKE
jgi:P27 family predicted phage terminase small subunit